MPITVKISDDILIAECRENIHLNMDIARQIVADRLKLQAGKSYPVVIHMNGLISDSKSVRMFMAAEGAEGISMGAFVVKKRYEEILVNLFLAIDAPKVPTSVFSNEQDAIAWIKEMQRLSQ